MSFFNLRRGGQSSKSNKAKAGPRAPAESLDIVRKRAKHRLIGAAVLVLIGVVGFPLLFDSQPRPVPVDIAIEIPDKNTVRPLVAPPPVAAPKSVAAAPLVAGTAVVVPSALPKEETVAAKQAPAPAVAVAPAPVPTTTPAAPAAPKVDDSARARALLEGKTPPSATATDTRMVVQVGAYAEASKVRDARLKLEKAGLKTYTQVVDTSDGKRTRVRVGPFPSRAEAEQVASKVKALGLPVTILTL
jgi:DedD protein